MVEKAEVVALWPEWLMQASIKVYADVFDVQTRLQQLGLKISDLLDAVRAAYQGRVACTELDPPLYIALSLWGHGVRRLRQRLVPRKWSISNEGGYCTVVSPDAALAIAVASGDANTGRPYASPTTLSAKGARTEEAISANQLSLDIRLPDEDEVEVADEQCETWYLLIYVDLDAAEVRAELSLPSGQDEQGRIINWVERIILPSTEVQADSADLPIDDLPDIDIEIKRRA
jgi:hypothetical protein